VDPNPILQRILTNPTTNDLLALQCILLFWEEKTDAPLERERITSALSLLEDFHGYLVGLESKLEAHAFAELASKMDMGAVGVVIAGNIRGAGDKLLERVLMGGLSETLMVLASRQYIKAFNRDLEAFLLQVAWQLRTHFWRFSAARCPQLPPSERTALIDSLFAPIFDKQASSGAKPVVLGCLFQVLLLGSLSGMLPA
jgi:hypothetical protein